MKTPIRFDADRTQMLLAETEEPTPEQRRKAAITVAIHVPPGEERNRVMRDLGLVDYQRTPWKRSRR